MKITIGIATNNRPECLDQCLSSLENNTRRPDVVIVVDNSLGKESGLIVKKHKANLHIIHVFEKKQGTSYVRNTILNNTKTEILAFVDDDTILPEDYIGNIVSLHKKYPKIIAIQGRSESLPKNAYLAKLISMEHADWIEKKKNGKYIDILDTKNASIKFFVLKNTHFKFDPIFARFNKGEDVDLAMFLASKNIKILFSSKIKNFHQENTNLLNILRRRVDAGRARWYLENKWGKYKFYLNKTKKSTIKNQRNLYQYAIGILILKIPYFVGYLFEFFLNFIGRALDKIPKFKRDSNQGPA